MPPATTTAIPHARHALQRLCVRLSTRSASVAATLVHSDVTTPRLMSPAAPAPRRGFHSTRGVAAKKRNDGNEAMLMQQMLDAMSFGDDDDEDASQDMTRGTDPNGQQRYHKGLLTLPVTGVVLDVKNNIASISGLRHATLGSVIAVYNRAANHNDNGGEKDGNATEDVETEAEAERVCRGVVLFLEKNVAHVALFRESSSAVDAIRNVQIGMQVQLEDTELRVPVSLARMAGRVVNPLGEPVADVEYADHDTDGTESAMPTANDRVSIAWGSKTVPGLMTRAPLREPFATGILAIDCLKPLAFGHRFGILGPRNSGKTRLALDIISQQVALAKQQQREPPHFVYVAVGKPASRVQQIVAFLDQTGALAHTTIVSADERDSRIMQYLAPFTGCAMAEYFMAHGKSQQSVVIYDDLATHTTIVESLVETMKLPKISQLSLCAHAVLMERSAQFLKSHGSLTTLAVADTPDAATGEVSPFMERIKSIVDDTVVLESQLARSRVYPPIDVLQPGSSVRGPPFQSVAMWSHMNAVRTRINQSFQIKENMDISRSLGLEIEPEHARVVEFQALVTQFFTQAPLATCSKLEKELGVFFLSKLRLVLLPTQTTIQEIVAKSVELLTVQNPELVHLLEQHPVDKPWSCESEDQLEKTLLETLAVLRREKQEARNSGKLPRELPAEVLRRFQQRRK